MGQGSIISLSKPGRILSSIAALCLVCMAGAASARQMTELAVSDTEAAPPAHVAQQGQVSLEQAIQIAQRQHQGRVVRAETKLRDGRRVHEIRILGNDGRMRTVRIDAQGDGRG